VPGDCLGGILWLCQKLLHSAPAVDSFQAKEVLWQISVYHTEAGDGGVPGDRGGMTGASVMYHALYVACSSFMFSVQT
jgi:hypothetical protein